MEVFMKLVGASLLLVIGAVGCGGSNSPSGTGTPVLFPGAINTGFDEGGGYTAVVAASGGTGIVWSSGDDSIASVTGTDMLGTITAKESGLDDG